MKILNVLMIAFIFTSFMAGLSALLVGDYNDGSLWICISCTWGILLIQEVCKESK